MWNGIDKDFANAGGPHKAPITLVEFSEKGGRLISCDTVSQKNLLRICLKYHLVASFDRCHILTLNFDS